MKKILCWLFACVLLTLSLSGCGSKKYSVTFKDDTEANYSVRQLLKMYEKNEREFQSIQHISGRGKITNTSVEKTSIYTSSAKRSSDLHDAYNLRITLDYETVLTVNLNYVAGANDVALYYEPYSEEIHGAYANSFFNGDTVSFSVYCQPYFKTWLMLDNLSKSDIQLS